MDVDVKGAAIGVASAVYASVGFLVSVFAVVLNPLIPSSVLSENPHPSLILHGSQLHRRTRPDRHDSSDLSASASAATAATAPASLQTNSIISASSQASSSAPSLHQISSGSRSQSPPPRLCEDHIDGGSDSGVPTPKPLRRPSAQSQNQSQSQKIPPANDYFSANHAEISVAAVRANARAETRLNSRPGSAAPTPPSPASSNPSPPNISQPALSRRPTPVPIPSPITAACQLPVPPIPVAQSHSCTLDEAPHSHSFRISHFKWTGRRDKSMRSATCPEAAPHHPDHTNADVSTDVNIKSKNPKCLPISRPPSSLSIKHVCPAKKTQKTLRKSLSSPEGGLSKWKPHRRRNEKLNPTHDILQHPPPPIKSPKASQVPSPPKSRPRSRQLPRTQPYEAPYFFPSPASPDVGDFMRRAKSARPPSDYSSQSYAPYNDKETPPTLLRPLSLPPGEGEKLEVVGEKQRRADVDRGVVSAPPTRLKFAE